MLPQEYKEKRGFLRSPIEALITFTVNDVNGISFRGKSQNICASGIYFTTDHAIKLNDHIKIKLHASRELATPLNLEGEVVRCKFDKKNNHLFHVSIKFSSTNLILAHLHNSHHLECVGVS